MQVLNIVSAAIGIVFVMCYAFQIAYTFIPFLKKLPKHKESSLHKYAVIVCARNEETVISNLVDSIRAQDYPAELIDIVLVADNCTDKTAEVGRSLGIRVYERFDDTLKGKGYALNYVLHRLDEDLGEDYYDAFVVFDADNILTENFFTEINKTFSDGYEVVTTYRNSKNYGDSWLSAGSGMWFIRESKYLNGSRMRIGACPQVSGTGFLFSNEIKKENDGWPFHTLTEDYEFTCFSVIKGKKFGYCEEARFYDEQVSTFGQAWNQRMRWCKGGLQSFAKFWRGLLKGIFSRNFIPSYDMAMSIAPAYVISMIGVVFQVIMIIVLLAEGNGIWNSIFPAICLIIGAYLLVLTQSVMTTITEWKHIKATTAKKILYIFTFPFYLMTFIPIAFVATFKRNVEWKPIHHSSLDESKVEMMNKKDDR